MRFSPATRLKKKKPPQKYLKISAPINTQGPVQLILFFLLPQKWCRLQRSSWSPLDSSCSLVIPGWMALCVPTTKNHPRNAQCESCSKWPKHSVLHLSIGKGDGQIWVTQARIQGKQLSVNADVLSKNTSHQQQWNWIHEVPARRARHHKSINQIHHIHRNGRRCWDLTYFSNRAGGLETKPILPRLRKVHLQIFLLYPSLLPSARHAACGKWVSTPSHSRWPYQQSRSSNPAHSQEGNSHEYLFTSTYKTTSTGTGFQTDWVGPSPILWLVLPSGWIWM